MANVIAVGKQNSGAYLQRRSLFFHGMPRFYLTTPPKSVTYVLNLLCYLCSEPAPAVESLECGRRNGGRRAESRAQNSASLRQTGGPSGVSERRWRFISSDTLSLSRRRVASPTRRSASMSRSLLSVSKSISWKRN